MESIGLEWKILYWEIFFLACLMASWLAYCFNKIILAIKKAATTDLNEITDCLDAIYASMERIESELQAGGNRREV